MARPDRRRSTRRSGRRCLAEGVDVEVIRADQVNEAYERVLASDVRYRFVIDAATI